VPELLLLNNLFAGNTRRLKALLFMCGALLMLSFSPFGWFVIAPLMLLPLLYGFLTCTPRAAAGLGFWFGAGLFLAGTYWLYISIHVFGEAPLFVAIFLMLALVVIMGLYYAATGWLISRLCRGQAIRLLWVAPSVWVALEWLRGWFLSGFPWMSVGYGQIDSPLATIAPVLGVYGLSLAVLLSASALLVTLMSRGTQRLLYALIAALPWLGGVLLQNIQWTDESGPAVTVTIIQGGITQDQKWQPDQFRPTMALYRNSIAEHPQSQLIIWPEVAIPAVLDRVEGYVDILQSDIRPTGQTLLFGILERDLDQETIYNSMVLLDGSSQQIYRKRHLVPFGEYFPVPDFVRNWMRLMSLPNSDLTPGDPVQDLLVTADGHKLAVAICYEDAYGAEQLYALPDAAILINASNDAWFGDSIAPHQHLEIARMRALEAGRPVVRATSTGLSVFIAADGTLGEVAPQFEKATLTKQVVPRRGMTPYASFGNLPVIALVILLMLGQVALDAWRMRK
jgi:apolipoprotein N-acyltransferase